MNAKIIQIIPAPADMRVYYENFDPDALRDKDGKKVAHCIAPACLALVQLATGDREIVPVTMNTDGSFELATYHPYLLSVEND